MRIRGLTTAFLLCCTPAFAEKIEKPAFTPVQAELMADLSARPLKVGATVFARVTVDWHGAACDLRTGAILEAHVASVAPRIKTAKNSELGLTFTRAQCGELKMHDFDLQLVAIAGPPEKSDLGLMMDSLPVRLSGVGNAALGDMKTTSKMNFRMETSVYAFPELAHMQAGQVSGIKGMKLNVGTGPGSSTVLTSKDRDVSLDKHTLFVLVPAQVMVPLAPAKPPPGRPSTVEATVKGRTITAETATASAAPTPEPDVDLCLPPHCNVALPTGNAVDPGGAAATISIRELGYAPRPQKAMESFDNDENLAYLGPRELLVAFNPHLLATRHVLGPWGSTARLIRAVLVNTQTLRVSRTVNWEILDYRQYLWPLADGRVLVHVGSELRVYGAGLEIQKRVSLDGPLAFVRVTPDGNIIAVGVMHERHTAELHTQLRESFNTDPEEDVNMVVLNRNFEVMAKSTTRAGLMAPTLLNEGQVRLLAMPRDRYRIAMETWDNRASTVARFSSTCTPEISSIASDLIFLVTCGGPTEGREYRVLHANGKLALKGRAMPNECGHAAGGSADQEIFVVKVVQSNMPMPSGTAFSAADFTSEELRVYRATDGKRLLGISVSSPSASRDGYALAPDGSQLAVLTRDQISVYSVPAK